MQSSMASDQYMVPTLPLKPGLGALMSKKVKWLLNQGEAIQKLLLGLMNEHTATAVASGPMQSLTMNDVGRETTPPPCTD